MIKGVERKGEVRVHIISMMTGVGRKGGGGLQSYRLKKEIN